MYVSILLITVFHKKNNCVPSSILKSWSHFHGSIISFSLFQENMNSFIYKVIQHDDDFILKRLFSHWLIILTPNINYTLYETFTVSLTPSKLCSKKAWELLDNLKSNVAIMSPSLHLLVGVNWQSRYWEKKV